MNMWEWTYPVFRKAWRWLKLQAERVNAEDVERRRKESEREAKHDREIADVKAEARRLIALRSATISR